MTGLQLRGRRPHHQGDAQPWWTRHGFRECFNPYTGEGQNARDFGWTSLVVDMPV